MKTPPAWALIAVALATPCCGRDARIQQGEHPIAEVRIEGDDSEASVFLASGVGVGDVVNLRPFDGFRPGMTLVEAERLHGKPTRVVRSEWETTFSYQKAGSVVQVVERQSLSSATNQRIASYVLRLPVNDPPFSDSLPSSLKQVWASNERLRLVTLVSKVSSDPIVRLEMDAGRVRSVMLGPSASSLQAPHSS